MPEMTDEEARAELRSVQGRIEARMQDRAEAEADVADLDERLVTLRKRERDLIAALTPERGGVPRVIRKA